jgi:hypothetical protein
MTFLLLREYLYVHQARSRSPFSTDIELQLGNCQSR